MMMQVATVIIYKSEPQNDGAMAIVFLMKRVHILNLLYWHIPSFFLFSYFYAQFFFKNLYEREGGVYTVYI